MTNYFESYNNSFSLSLYLCIFSIIISIIISYYYKAKKHDFSHILDNSCKNFVFDTNFIKNIKYDSSPLIKCIDEFCKNNNVYLHGTIVSLSGGVDSMVTLAILLFLQQQNFFPIFTASIDYGLREESADESRFLMKYTEMFKLKSYISYISGITRKQNSNNSRTEFEETSRNIRFNTYKQIIEANSLNSNVGIFVGHHQDDIIENIFTNSLKGSDILDLEVMKHISIINNVNIFRPLLKFKKQVIYDFAHTFNIPYFLDTTPLWSKRGKMRNEIFPLLDNVFGDGWKNKMKQIGEQSNEWGDYINSHIIKPWIDKCSFGNAGVIIPINEQPKLIYSKIIMTCLHNIGENMIKKSSIDKIMDLILLKQNNIVSLDGFRYAFITDANNSIIIFNSKKITKNTELFKLTNDYQIYNELINGVFYSESSKHVNKLKKLNNFLF